MKSYKDEIMRDLGKTLFILANAINLNQAYGLNCLGAGCNNQERSILRRSLLDSCPDGSIQDCSDKSTCVNEDWVGDGYPDCGQLATVANTTWKEANLTCYGIENTTVVRNGGNDGGDCDTDEPTYYSYGDTTYYNDGPDSYQLISTNQTLIIGNAMVNSTDYSPLPSFGIKNKTLDKDCLCDQTVYSTAAKVGLEFYYINNTKLSLNVEMPNSESKFTTVMINSDANYELRDSSGILWLNNGNSTLVSQHCLDLIIGLDYTFNNDNTVSISLIDGMPDSCPVSYTFSTKEYNNQIYLVVPNDSNTETSNIGLSFGQCLGCIDISDFTLSTEEVGETFIDTARHTKKSNIDESCSNQSISGLPTNQPIAMPSVIPNPAPSPAPVSNPTGVSSQSPSPRPTDPSIDPPTGEPTVEPGRNEKSNFSSILTFIILLTAGGSLSCLAIYLLRGNCERRDERNNHNDRVELL